MKVSVIIPVYNVEKYLSRCILSVFEQTYDNLEIILVDDGTKDNSGKLCDEYSLQDNRVKVIHKEHEGLSSARNAGIEIATGDAVCFLDSDDYISRDCIKKTVSLLEEYEADISIIQMKYIPENVNEECADSEAEKVEVMIPEKAIEESLYQKLYSCSAPAKLFRKKAIGNVRFPLGKISEDLATCHLFLNNATKIVYSSYCGYYYRQHASSIMHVFNEKRLDALEWAKNIEKFCAEYYPDIVKAAYCRTFNVAVHLILELPENGEEHDRYFEQLWCEVERTRMKTLMNCKARGREKIAVLLSFGGESLLRKSWNSRIAVRRG